jgi:hypothetical protein
MVLESMASFQPPKKEAPAGEHAPGASEWDTTISRV